MPIIAVAVAIFADVAAGAAVAATVGGIAAISATTALEIVAAVGATVGAIGAVTRDKTLSTVGLALGAVGGIGALASSAGLFGAEAASGASLFGGTPEATGSAFGSAASDASNAATYGATAGSTVAGEAASAGMSVADAASANTIDFIAGTSAASAAPPGDLTTLATTSENALDPAAALTGARPTALAAGSDTTTNILGGGVGLPTPPVPPSQPPIISDATGSLASGDASASGQGFVNTAGGTPGGGGGVEGFTAGDVPADKGIFGKIMDFADKHPVAALGALQAGGSLLSGATSTLTPAQVNALNAQAAQNQSAANLLTQQQKNLAMPKAVASLAPVTGAPQPLVPPISSGFINAAPKLAPVTGAVA